MAVTEKNVKDHQIYRDTFMDCSEWLSSMVDGLNLCSDVRGDRTAIEAQIQKLQVNRLFFLTSVSTFTNIHVYHKIVYNLCKQNVTYAT
jgi:hypothetical protein